MQATLELFGRFQLLVDGTSLKFATEHSRALFAYLVMEPGVHNRTTLSGLIWPDHPETSARQNLRQTLFNLKQALKNTTLLASALVVTSTTIEFLPDRLSTDVQQFGKLWAACDVHTHPQLATCVECHARLQQMTDLYAGEFLQNVHIRNSTLFEEWTFFLREQLRRRMLEVLALLTHHDELVGDYAQMQHNATRQLALEPWREEAHRQLMRAFALNDQGTSALAHYAVCRRVLDEELGVLPSAATTALYEQIKRGDFERGMHENQGVRREAKGKIESETKQEIKQELQPQVTGEANQVEANQVEASQDEASQEKESKSPSQFPRIPSLPPHNLPSSLTPFVGREEEVEEVIARLIEPETRLLTLVGPGGIGKTRLAIEVAQRLYAQQSSNSLIHSSVADGIFFVSLAPLSSSDALASAIASALDLDFHSDPRQTVLNHLPNKSLVLVLDNFEHLLDGILQIVEIIARSPNVRILATSRERLNVRSEQLYPVPSLTHSPQGELTEATNWSAVRLFVERARRVLPDFKVTESNLPDLLRICELVQGMPLGLEMAAAWCNTLPLDEIASEIEHSLDFLAVDYHDLPERHLSMRAVLDWSWRLLREDEALVLCQVAVFRGGFTRQAAENICAASLRILNGLVNKSLLSRSLDANEKSGVASGRYELHGLLRQFAQEKLITLPDVQTRSMTRHSDFYLAFVAERERRLMRNEPRQAMSEIRVELDNVRQAWTRAVEQRIHTVLDLSAYGLWQFYMLAGLSAEGALAFRQAAIALQELPAARTDQSSLDSQRSILSKLWSLSAMLLRTDSKYDEAIETAQHAISYANTADCSSMSTEGTALGHLALAQAWFFKNQLSETQRHCEQVLQAVHTAQREGMPGEIWPELYVWAQIFLNGVAHTQGDYQLAKSHLAECLRLCQQLGKLRGEVHVQLNLGWTQWLAREDHLARQTYEQVLPLTLAMHYRWGEGDARYHMALVVRNLGEYSLALEFCQQALLIYAEINERPKQIKVLSNLVEIFSYLGQFERAGDYQGQLAALLQQIEAPEAERLALAANTILAHEQGNYERALVCAQQLWQLVQSTDSRLFQAEALTLLGDTQFGLHLYATAAANYTQALTLYQSLDARAQAADTHAGLAAISLVYGDTVRALQFTEATLSILEEYPNAGLYEPFAIYLICYRVLVATHDERAYTVLQQAYSLLHRYAARIEDAGMRDSYLQNVSTHRQLIIAYEEATKNAMDNEGAHEQAPHQKVPHEQHKPRKKDPEV